MSYIEQVKIISITLFISFGVTGCLKAQLHSPAEDHAVQTEIVASECKQHGYGHGRCRRADMDAMRDQAKCILAIIENNRCEIADADEGGTE